MSVDVDLTTVNTGTRDPPAVFCEDAADLMDVNLFLSPSASQLVDLDGDRQGLFRDYDGVEISLDR